MLTLLDAAESLVKLIRPERIDLTTLCCKACGTLWTVGCRPVHMDDCKYYMARRIVESCRRAEKVKKGVEQ